MKERDYNIDLIKAVSIFAVVVIHVNSTITGADPLSKTWYFSILVGSLVRFAVPMFFMCTGAILYDKKRVVPIRKIWSKYIKRFVIAFVFWDLVYKLIMVAKQYFFNLNISSQNDIIKMFLEGNNKYHLYFIIILVCIYAFMPVVKEFINNGTDKILKYLLGFWIVSSIILPYIFYLFPVLFKDNLVRQYSWNYIYTFLGYSIWGYYLKTNIEKYGRIKALLLGFLSLGAIISVIIYKGHISGETDLFYWEGQNILVFIYTSSLFVFLNKIRLKGEKKLVARLSESGFSIFLTHVIFLELLGDFNIDVYDLPSNIKLFYPLVVSVSILILSYLLYFLIIKRLPFKHYIS